MATSSFFREALDQDIISQPDFEDAADALSQSADEGVIQYNSNERLKDKGGGHAVTVLGWDDQYRAPTIDRLDQLIETFKEYTSIDPGSLDKLKRWARKEGYTYSNKGRESKGAWFIQNSWGKGENEFQYLPYDYASPEKTFHLADETGLLGRIDSSSSIPALGGIIQGNTQYEEIEYQFRYNDSDTIAGIGVYPTQLLSNTDVNYTGGRVKASLYRVGELDQQPIATTESFEVDNGYRTLRFTSPIKVENATNLVAVLSYEGSSQSALGAWKLDVENLLASSTTNHTPDQISFWADIPLYYNSLVKTEGNSIAQDVYFGKNDSGWQDLSQNQEVVFINVVYANKENLLSDAIDIITGSTDADKIYINDENNTIDAGDGDDTIFARFAKNRIRLDEGNDTVIATEARGKDLIISGGAGDDEYVFSLGKGNHFRGQATITDFEKGDIVQLYQFKQSDLESVRELRSATIFDFGDFELKIKGEAFSNVAFENGVIA